MEPPEIFPQPRIQAAPQALRTGQTPAMLLLHGAADTIVRPHNSAILAARVQQAGGHVRHVSYPGMGHLGPIIALAEPARWLGLANGAVRDEVAEFLLRDRASARAGRSPS